MPPIDWPQLLVVLAAFAAAVWAWIKLFVETAIKERIKSSFDHELEKHKTALDREKQMAIKTFGLFADKKYDTNAQVYTTLRTAYHTINTLALGGRSPIDTTLFNADEVDQFLASAGAELQDRKPLVQLHEIDRQIAAAEINRARLWLERKKASTELATASDTTYTNEIFLARAVVMISDEIIESLRMVFAIISAAQPDQRERNKETLERVPMMLARMVSEMRADLLGVGVELQDPPIVRKSSPVPPLYHGIPDSVPISRLTDVPDLAGQLNSVHLNTDTFQKATEDRTRAAERRLAEADKALVANPADRTARLSKTQSLLALGKPADAEKEARNLLATDLEDLDATLLLSECLLHMGRLFEALPQLDKYLDQRKDNASAFMMRGSAVMFFNWQAPEEDFRSAVALAPNSATAHAWLGEMLHRQKRSTEAVKEIVQALQLQPENSIAQLSRLDILAQLGHWAVIVGLSDELLLVFPDNTKVIRWIGCAYNYLGRFSDAVAFANRFLGDSAGNAISPGIRTAAFAIRAAARFGLKEYEAAVSDADRAVGSTTQQSGHFFESHADAYFTRAEALEALKRWDEAVLAAKAAYPCMPFNGHESARVVEILKNAFQQAQSASGLDETASLGELP